MSVFLPSLIQMSHLSIHSSSGMLCVCLTQDRPLRCLVTRIIHTLHRLWAAHCRSARGHGNAWGKKKRYSKNQNGQLLNNDEFKIGMPAIPSTELVATTQWTSYFDSLKPPTVIQVQLSYHHHPPRNHRRWRYSSHKLAPSCCCKMCAVPLTPEERRRLEPQASTMDTLDLPFWHTLAHSKIETYQIYKTNHRCTLNSKMPPYSSPVFQGPSPKQTLFSSNEKKLLASDIFIRFKSPKSGTGVCGWEQVSTCNLRLPNLGRNVAMLCNWYFLGCSRSEFTTRSAGFARDSANWYHSWCWFERLYS